MTHRDIVRLRLHNQQLSSSTLTRAEDVVRRLGAVQAQDYHGAKWGIGQRMQGATDQAIEEAVAHGRILRTHVMRPTWHFVAGGDIRWLLALTAPRVHATTGAYCRTLGLGAADFTRSRRVLEKALKDGKQLMRDEVRVALLRAGIETDSQRLAYHLMRAELDGVICSGARKGSQFTYALLDARAPSTSRLSRDEALSALTNRYFSSRGPAQLQDFVWWSGLTTADARRGIDGLGRQLVSGAADGRTYWWSADGSDVGHRPRTAYLLPLYDEYLIAYKDRSAANGAAYLRQAAGDQSYDPPMVWGGRIAGSWQRTLRKNAVTVTLNPFAGLKAGELEALRRAARRYAAFLGLPLTLESQSA